MNNEKNCTVCELDICSNKKCKFYAWLEKNNILNKIPTKYKTNEVILILNKIFYGEINYLNELCDYCDFQLNDIVYLIRDILQLTNINNKKLRVLVKCDNCGKETEKHMCKLKNNNFNFCSHTCYSKFRSIYYIKEKASVYNSIPVECNYCKKIIYIPKNKQLITNKEGKNHNFCSHECYSKFRSVYYTGNKLYNTGKSMPDWFKEQCRINTTKCYADGKIKRNTKPQLLVNQMLLELDISYENEKTFKYYSIDNYLNDYNLAIEVMGDYFHANPHKYDYSKLNKMQLKDVARDKRKHTYIKKYYDIEILYLWENDINKEYEKCKALILKYINTSGKLSNYHSYNYFYKSNLYLNSIIKNPYFIKNP